MPVRAILLLCLALVIPCASAAQTPRLTVEVEGGPVWQSSNQVEIPNDGTATRFSLLDVVGRGPWAAGRVYVVWNLAERHGLRLLLAPLSVTASGVLDEAVEFAGASFDPGQARATYTFNSYRLSYRYRFRDTDRVTAWAGFTAKVRDAEIGLEQGTTSGASDDLGFVPLLHLAGEWRVAPAWRISADADALAGGPGRAVDAALKVSRRFHDNWSVSAGYRTVEGGADVTSVYNFAWLHYAVLAVTWQR
ncbi:MAG TPA: hypothetical protein VK929_04615 [Longimicrobiales bacterium]|nr:hypothetical protein [Longimicrobiales bacterium]